MPFFCLFPSTKFLTKKTTSGKCNLNLQKLFHSNHMILKHGHVLANYHFCTPISYRYSNSDHDSCLCCWEGFQGDYIRDRISIPSRISRIPGLSSDDIKQLMCFDYKAEAKGNSSVECVVCLENFKGGEKCRMLPICNHTFHVQCIDSWLLKTAACPICRARANAPQIGEETSRSSEIEV